MVENFEECINLAYISLWAGILATLYDRNHICLSEADLIHLISQSPVASIFLRMTLLIFFTDEKHLSVVYAYHIFFHISSVMEHLDRSHILSIVNGAEINIGVYLSDILTQSPVGKHPGMV